MRNQEHKAEDGSCEMRDTKFSPAGPQHRRRWTYGHDESRPPRDALRICMPAAGSEKRRSDGLFNKIFHADEEWPRAREGCPFSAFAAKPTRTLREKKFSS